MVVVNLQRGQAPVTRSRVEAESDLLELGLALDVQVGALGQVLAQQVVGVLPAAA
jgi:hypothetical protein